MMDYECLQWLEDHFFTRKWDGTLGRASYWELVGNWRHIIQKLEGPDLATAISNLVKKEQRE